MSHGLSHKSERPAPSSAEWRHHFLPHLFVRRIKGEEQRKLLKRMSTTETSGASGDPGHGKAPSWQARGGEFDCGYQNTTNKNKQNPQKNSGRRGLMVVMVATLPL